MKILAYFSQEPCNQVAEYDGLVGFRVTWRRGDSRNRPQVALPLVQVSVRSAGIEEKDSRCTVDEPSSVQGLDAPIGHGLDGSDKSRVLWFYLLDLDRCLQRPLAVLWGGHCCFVDKQGPYRISVERSQQCVCRAILGRRDLSLGLED